MAVEAADPVALGLLEERVLVEQRQVVGGGCRRGRVEHREHPAADAPHGELGRLRLEPARPLAVQRPERREPGLGEVDDRPGGVRDRHELLGRTDGAQALGERPLVEAADLVVDRRVTDGERERPRGVAEERHADDAWVARDLGHRGPEEVGREQHRVVDGEHARAPLIGHVVDELARRVGDHRVDRSGRGRDQLVEPRVERRRADHHRDLAQRLAQAQHRGRKLAGDRRTKRTTSTGTGSDVSAPSAPLMRAARVRPSRAAAPRRRGAWCGGRSRARALPRRCRPTRRGRRRHGTGPTPAGRVRRGGRP